MLLADHSAHAGRLRDGIAAFDRRDYAAAASLLWLPAGRGDSRAQALLCFMYTYGRGVPQSAPEAAGWCDRAANQGNTEAQYMLGLLYNKGHGVPEDFIEAYKWLDLAAARASGSKQDFSYRIRDAVATKMSPAQIARAQDLAIAWRPRPELRGSALIPGQCAGHENVLIDNRFRRRCVIPGRRRPAGMEPSLSVDVVCTMTADFFTQMRVCMNLQRALVNQMILDQGLPPNPVDWGLPPGAASNVWPTPAPGIPAPLTTRDVLRYATTNGAKALRLDGKTGSLTPGKEADIIILDATKLNVAPLNQVPGAVVSLMDRTNVETVIVAGKVRKWKGQLLDVDLPRLRQQLEASRDFIFNAAGVPQNLFGSQ
jgi:hypothetical protein